MSTIPEAVTATESAPGHSVNAYLRHKLYRLECERDSMQTRVARLEAKRNVLNQQVRQLWEESILLQESSCSLADVIKPLGDRKALVKVHPDGRMIVEVDRKVDMAEVVANARVALRSDSYKLVRVLPSQVDPLVALMKVEKVPDSTYDVIGGLDKQIRMIAILFSGRYLILVMSVMAILTGFIYNDYFGLAFPLFGTSISYASPDDQFGISEGVYAFGMDPNWHWANNSMTFINSYKMKMSVLLGVSQMIWGLFLRLVNLLHFKKYLELFGSWIGEVIFMFGIFGYLCFSIVYKWLHHWPNPDVAPSLTNMMIQMFLTPGYIDFPLFRASGPAFQASLQGVLAAVSIGAVVWMGCVIPIAACTRKPTHYETLPDHTPEGETKHVEEEDDEDGHSLGDIIIHQGIHVIEYCLECVSHTASYLRLWALSLAHSQLSEVFFEQLMDIGLHMNVPTALRAVILCGLFCAWLGFSAAVLLAIENLSAFLHCLRLHWVEWQSKFLEADGYEFAPLAFEPVTSLIDSAIVARKESAD
ncbi:V-type ATPase, V0 complex, 116kDa subunit family [Kipferlia bialata]|uniref:V-type proton ATPase subunit a n=1 Tax=Kipferlia bialata TaxID=797122 RepID=A0A9K3GG40_9EUKA|nr:V-type ATPase, V0 complex, 116kDa subunit family [Kipferlia bialata]|eukprot:g1693.t1